MDGLQLALHFTVLHANPPWSEGTRGNAGWTTATSDNSTLHYWPVDVDEERVTLSSGVMVRSTVAGYTLKDGVTVPAPEELHLPHRVTLDPEVLAATRSVFVGEHDTTTPACPLGEYITDEVRRVLLAGGTVDRVEVVITHEPAWTPEMMADDTKQAFGWGPRRAPPTQPSLPVAAR